MRKIIAVFVFLLLSFSAKGESWQIAPYTPGSLEIASNRHAQMDDPGVAAPLLSTDGFDLVAETESAGLYLNREYHTLRLVDTRTGYVWGAIPLTDARSLNKSWKSYAASILSIECFDKKNNEKRYGMADSAVKTVYTLKADGFDCHVNFTALSIEMTVSVRLRENQLTFRVENESITEAGDFKLKSIAFMPYLGSVYEDETPSWFLLPDGPGALMRFRKSGSYVAGYDKRIYGNDLSVSASTDAQFLNSIRPNDYVRQDAQVLTPVYGIVHGVAQNGLLCVVEDGELYASIVATPAGLGNTKYNSIMMRFEVRQKYNLSTNQSGAGAAVPQEKRNTLSPTLTFHLLAGAQADYDQMAVYYRSLLGLGRLAEGKPAMKVEVLCAAARYGFLPGAVATLTTLEEAGQIARSLQGDGIGPMLFTLSQYTVKNLPGNGLSTGSAEELDALRALVEGEEGRLLLGLDPVCANRDQINLRLQAASGMSLSPICLRRDNYVILYPETYFFRLSNVSQWIQKARIAYAGYAFAVDQAGSRLYGDYTTNAELTRAQSAAAMRSALDGLRIGAMYTPNQLMWDQTNVFLDMPLVGGQYLYETDTVPFLPMVLSGSMEMYAASMNLGVYSRDRMLRMLEYGVLPAFTVTACNNRLLSETSLSDASSTCFTDWREFMGEAWAYMRPALERIQGKGMEAHTVMAQGRVCVTFENGVLLIVNYTDTPWDSPYGTVPPHDYRIGEVGK